MCNSLRLEMKYRDEFANDFMSQTYSSYMEYKYNYEEARLRHLIHSKYLKVLGKFIEDMYSGLRFDIFIRQRDPKQKSMDWFGHTYMELRIFDVIMAPVYNPMNFDPVYKTPHYEDYISGWNFFETINDFIPEINKHLLISFRPIISPQIEIHNMQFNDIPDFECWREYFIRQSRKNITISTYQDPFIEPQERNDFHPF